MRLDKYLKEQYPHLSRQQIINQIKKGLVLVNNHKVKPSFQVKPKDVITFFPPETEKLKKLTPLPLKLDIIFENNNFLVINKPAGLTVHPGHCQKEEPTLVQALIYYYPEIKKVGEDASRPGLVHRLDKDTSGLMVIAKNNPTFRALKEQFQNHQVEKSYLALVWGRVKQNFGTINFPLTRSSNPLKRKAIISPANLNPTKKIKTASTHFKVVKRFKNFTLLEVFPKTGRTHQIRVHLAALGYPVVGDKQYGFKNKDSRLPLKRQFLHAASLRFSLGNENFKFEAELPPELKEFLDCLKS